jgi:hypothetical protein
LMRQAIGFIPIPTVIRTSRRNQSLSDVCLLNKTPSGICPLF